MFVDVVVVFVVDPRSNGRCLWRRVGYLGIDFVLVEIGEMGRSKRRFKSVYN